MFQSFPPFLTWLAVVGLPFDFISLPPPILCHGDFMKSLATSRNCQEGLPWQGLDENAAASDYRKAKYVGKLLTVAMVQRNLTVKVSIADITTKVENDQHAQAHEVSAKTVHHSSQAL